MDYKKLVTVDYSIPRCKRRPRGQGQSQGTLYPITIKSSNSSRVLIHYIGYGPEHDEWRNLEDIEKLQSPCMTLEEYDFYQELAMRIKSTLLAKRKANPVTRIDMPFDRAAFEGGLKSHGQVKQYSRGTHRYKIAHYSDIEDLLGKNWHYRGVNSAGDFCYAILETVEFYLYHRRPLIHYIANEHGKPIQTSTPRGYMLVFKFVRGDGTKSEFGRNREIFPAA